MIHDLPITAGRAGTCLSLSYNGFTRLVEVHAVGVTSAGNRVMRVFQVAGGSSSGESFGWKLMRLDAANDIAVSDQVSQAPRPLYKRGDRAMRRIDWQI